MSISLKRKNEDEDELVEGIIHLRKRAKLEEIIFRAVSEKDKSQAHFSESKIAKRCDKLLTSIQLKKKYKYHCKKHNVSYLVDSVRKEKKQISKQNRNNLVESFRSLAVSAADLFDAPNDGSTSYLDKNENHLMPNQINDVKNDDLNDVFKKPEMPLRKGQKRKASNSPLEVNKNRSNAINSFKRLAVQSTTEETALDEHQGINNISNPVGTSTPKVLSPNKHRDSGYDDGLLTPKLSFSSLPKLIDGTFTLSDGESDVFDYFPREYSSGRKSHPKKKMLPCKINFDDKEDSDCERNQQEQFKKYKIIESFVVTKNPEKGGIVFQKGLDYLETDNDANDSDCDCSVYDSLISEASNFEYSSSSEDESDGIFTG